MKIKKLGKILMAAMLVIVAVPACQGDRTPTPTLTPTPVAAREFYSNIAAVATQQPGGLDGMLNNGLAYNIIGQVTNSYVDNGTGVIEFHMPQGKEDFAPDRYIKCEMIKAQDAQSVTINSVISVHGWLKDAFDDGERLRDVRPQGNNAIDLENCTIIGN